MARLLIAAGWARAATRRRLVDQARRQITAGHRRVLATSLWFATPSVQEFTIGLFHQLVPLGVFLVLGMAVITLVPDAVNWRPNFRMPIDISWSLSMPIT